MEYKFSEYLELLLRIIYEYDTKFPGQFFDLNEISKMIQVDNIHRIIEAADVLESRGLVKVQKFLGGGCLASLTGHGRLLIEEGGNTGIIKKYDEKPEEYNITISNSTDTNINIGDKNVIEKNNSTDINEERKLLFDLLNEIKERIKADTNINEESKDEKIIDIDGIEGQLKKKEPNMNIITSFIESISNIASISNLIGKLMELLRLT